MQGGPDQEEEDRRRQTRGKAGLSLASFPAPDTHSHPYCCPSPTRSAPHPEHVLSPIPAHERPHLGVSGIQYTWLKSWLDPLV